jgi:hypothetical protein
VVLFGLRIKKKLSVSEMELQKNPGGYDMFLVIDKLKIVKTEEYMQMLSRSHNKVVKYEIGNSKNPCIPGLIYIYIYIYIYDK